MRKKRVYVETSAISYLTADKPTIDILKLARRHLTRRWWEQRNRWNLFVSSAIVEEISAGDRQAAAKRLRAIYDLPVLEERPETEKLATRLVVGAAVPVKAYADAAHLALAALHGMDYLVTWNMKHLDKKEMREKVNAIIKEQGLSPAQVVTPERLMEMDDD